ncbi:hypothetical protein, partial [Nocardiopsis sp. CC223A]|uniref:hypothetical protein n=1 Tax=Nocardiopsis sp. CC223A TaxID=3044051 RepID=UPI0027957691
PGIVGTPSGRTTAERIRIRIPTVTVPSGRTTAERIRIRIPTVRAPGGRTVAERIGIRIPSGVRTPTGGGITQTGLPDHRTGTVGIPGSTTIIRIRRPTQAT